MNWNIRRFGICLFLLIFLAGTINAETVSVTNCNPTWTSGETYELQNNISGIVGTCFNITVDNVTLDCQGNTITGDGTGHGIDIPGRTNITIKNCIISSFKSGIYLYSSSNNNLTNNNANSNRHGIYLYSSSNNTLTNNTANSNNQYGISLESSPNNRLTNNSVNSNGVFGIYLDYSDSTSIINNTINSNNYEGIRLYCSSNCIITNNTLQENDDFDLLVSPGLEKCYSKVCNNIIENNTGSGDRPIKYYNDSVILQNEVLSELILCNADYSSINNVTIEGSATKDNNHLYIMATEGSNFTNIISSNNYYGIEILGSSYNNLINNTANSNRHGIWLYASSHNNFTNNTASSNEEYGIRLSSSSYNTLTNNTANSNAYRGIYFFSSSYNNITNNTAAYNRIGLYFSSNSNNNNVTSNSFYENTEYDIKDDDANFGSNNTCDIISNWNDEGTTGCTYISPPADLHVTKTINKINATGGAVPASDIGVNDILLYTLSYGNTGEYKGRDTTIIDNIPINTIYVSGTANSSKENVTIYYSTDWGTTWQTTEPKAGTVTRIKWLLGNVSVGETGNVSFRVQVYGGAGSLAARPELSLPTLLAVFVEYTEKNVIVVLQFAIIVGVVAALVNSIINVLREEFLRRQLTKGKRRKKVKKRR